jgi:hypothetical protein
MDPHNKANHEAQGRNMTQASLQLWFKLLASSDVAVLDGLEGKVCRAAKHTYVNKL